MPHQDRSVLSRVGQGILAFGADTTSSNIDAIRADRDIAENQARIGEQQIASNDAETLKAQRGQELLQVAFGGGPDSDRAAAQLSVEFPEQFEQISESMGLRTQGQKNEASDFALRLRNTPFEGRQAMINERVATLASAGRDPQHTASLTGQSEEDQNNALRVTELLALSPEDRVAKANASAIPAEQASFEALIADFTPADQKVARRIKAGLEGRAIGSAAQTIAEEGTADVVAGSEAIIAGSVQTAKTEAQIKAELRLAGETATAAARQAALVTRAQEGEKISAGQVRTAVEAQLLLPTAEAGATEMTVLLTDIRNDPLLPDVLGRFEGGSFFGVAQFFDENERALVAKINQVLGKTFLEAYQSLKGGGPITDREGQAATEAQSRLTDRTVSVEAYQGAIDELINITNSRITRLRTKARPPAAQPSTVGRFTIETVP